MEDIKSKVLDRFLAGLRGENLDYRGIIYFGLMITDKGPHVLEFNTRFGDPETQVILPRLTCDLAEIFQDILQAKLDPDKIQWDQGSCATVILSSGGYPDSYDTGKEIRIDERAQELAMIFHGGTKNEGGGLVTSGGRVMAVTSLGRDIEEALERAYRAASLISFDNMAYRHDIGKGSRG